MPPFDGSMASSQSQMPTALDGQRSKRKQLPAVVLRVL
jgi:hypothetical protein